MDQQERKPSDFDEVEAIPQKNDDQDFNPDEDEKRIPVLDIKRAGDRYEIKFSVERRLVSRLITVISGAAIGVIGYIRYHG